MENIGIGVSINIGLGLFIYNSRDLILLLSLDQRVFLKKIFSSVHNVMSDLSGFPCIFIFLMKLLSAKVSNFRRRVSIKHFCTLPKKDTNLEHATKIKPSQHAYKKVAGSAGPTSKPDPTGDVRFTLG